MYIVFDTETTGLPKDWKAPVSQVHNWPRVVQLAWSAYDASMQLVAETSLIVQPTGFTIPTEAARIHGISQERALDEGHPMQTVLAQFLAALGSSDIVVGHNLDFDEKVMGAEFIRHKADNGFQGKRMVCTKAAATNYCQLPGKYGYKWPTLAELHQKLFESDFENAHDALGDVRATVRCYFELKKRGIVG